MVASYLSLDALAPALTSNDLILVPNNRLRNHLLRAYAKQQPQKAWIKPNIQSLNQWLDSLWESLQNNARDYACVNIATSLQRQIIWEAAIQNSTIGARLLLPKPLALQADSALKNLQLWQLTPLLTSNYFSDGNNNTSQFIEWLDYFNNTLKLQGSITKETSFELIAKAFMDGHLSQIHCIYLEGFDDIPPLVQHILNVATNTLINLPQQTTPNPSLIRTQASSLDEEIKAAALWAYATLQRNPTDAFIGIVAPDLGQSRNQVERIFTEVFEAQSLSPEMPRYTLPFNFSAGIPLGSTPLISSFFDSLQLLEEKWPIESICQLLNSPFWGNEKDDFIVRAHLSIELRKLEQLEVSGGDLRYCLTKLEKAVPQFAQQNLYKQFEEIASLARRMKRMNTAENWIGIFDQLVATINWPGARRLDSQEFQQLNQWFDIRDQYTHLDSYFTEISFTQACRFLREIADKSPFQAQTPDSPIQILGALEAAGLQFSHLWVMGLSDNQWPPVPAPNPLIPLELQREHNMPHASASRELEIAEGLTARYKKSAQEIIFSHAHSEGDNELRPSALIRDIPLTEISRIIQNDTSALNAHYDRLLSTHQLEIIHDHSGPRLQKNELVRGGSSLFKLQATCPFEAFVRLRLGARNPDQPLLGFSPADRGNLLHNALAAIWREIKDARTLATIDADALHQLVSSVCQRIIGEMQSKHPRQLGKVYCDIEHLRLTTLLIEWLNGERERPAFTVIAIEEESEIEFAGLTLNLRLDRIDEFENGDRLLIDYKTGSASAKSWLEERVTEPQLPLYAVVQEDISAISFAQINRKQQKWDGLGTLHDASLNQQGIKPCDDWQLQLHTWRTQLEQLALDFIAGDARIDFKNKTLESYASDLIPLTRLADEPALARFSSEGEKA